MSGKPKGAKKTAGKSAEAPALVPQKHGGALLSGGMPGNAGGGRPQDRLVAELRSISLDHGVPLIRDTITGKLELPLIGVCEACQHEQPFSEEWTEVITNRIKASIGDRLKANEQALKYGQAKELVITDKNAGEFFDCIHHAIGEIFGDGADAVVGAVKARAMVLMEGKK